MSSGVTRRALVRFHTVHKYLLMAHSQQQYQVLGVWSVRLIAPAQRNSPTIWRTVHEGVGREGDGTQACECVAPHLGYFKDRLGATRKPSCWRDGDYHHGLTPLIVPLTLIKHYVQIFDVGYIREQVYLNPHPKELMLRNHV